AWGSGAAVSRGSAVVIERSAVVSGAAAGGGPGDARTIAAASTPAAGNQHAREQQNTDTRHVALHRWPLPTDGGQEFGTRTCRAGAGRDYPDDFPECKNCERNPGIGSSNVR